MASSYVIRDDLRLVLVQMVGRVGFSEVEGMWGRVTLDRAFEPGFQQLLDLRQADLSPLTADDVSRLSRSTRAAATGRQAFVTAGELAFGLFRMYALYADSGNHEAEAFRSLEDACRWLEVPLQEVERALGGAG